MQNQTENSGNGLRPIEDVKNELIPALSFIKAKEFEGRSIVELDWIKEVIYKGQKVSINLVLPTYALTSEAEIASEVKSVATTTLSDQTPVEVNVYSEVKPVFKEHDFNPKVADVKNVILVSSAKGGVGKSTIASNLALSLAKMGCQVGLIDADVYGPSIPTMFGLTEEQQKGVQAFKIEDDEINYMIPKKAHGVQLMSLGFLADTKSPMAWRGPMISNAAMQMFYQTAWGDLDYLIVDLPPGTGDIQLSLAQKVVVAGAIIVSTPQAVALADVVRGKAMFDKVKIPILGLVENMSYFMCDGCDKKHELFSHGGAKKAAEELGLKFLAELPFETKIREAADTGKHENFVAFESLASDIALDLAKQAENQKSTKQNFGVMSKTKSAPKKKGALNVIN